MSKSFDTMRTEVQSSPSMMTTYKEYCMSFIDIKEEDLSNDWGWFVDIELDSEPIQIKRGPKPSQYVSIMKTIPEYPSIHSMKSMLNLHDTSMIFKMDNVDNNKHKTNKGFSVITHTIWLIVVIICYYCTCRNL